MTKDQLLMRVIKALMDHTRETEFEFKIDEKTPINLVIDKDNDKVKVIKL